MDPVRYAGVGRDKDLAAAPPLPEVVRGFGDLLSKLPGAVSGLPIPKMALFEKIFGTPKEFGAQLSATIMGAIQGGGNVWTPPAD